MILERFPDADMLYIQLTDSLSVESDEITMGVVPDLDAQNQIVGVEIEDASKRIDLS